MSSKRKGDKVKKWEKKKRKNPSSRAEIPKKVEDVVVQNAKTLMKKDKEIENFNNLSKAVRKRIPKVREEGEKPYISLGKVRNILEARAVEDEELKKILQKTKKSHYKPSKAERQSKQSQTTEVNKPREKLEEIEKRIDELAKQNNFQELVEMKDKLKNDISNLRTKEKVADPESSVKHGVPTDVKNEKIEELTELSERQEEKKDLLERIDEKLEKAGITERELPR